MKIINLYSFRETPHFTKRLAKHLSDDEYSELQWFLIDQPEVGKVVPGGGGIRKMRWQAEGRGKRGGLRVIYYLATAQGEIFLLDLYAKNERADLSPDDLRDLRELVKEWLG